MSGQSIHDLFGSLGADPFTALQAHANFVTRALVEVLQEHHDGEVTLEPGILHRSLGDDLGIALAQDDEGRVTFVVVPTPEEFRHGTQAAAIPGAVCCGDLYDHAANDDAPLRRFIVERVDEDDKAHLKSSSGLLVSVPTATLLAHEDGWCRAARPDRP